MNGTLNFLQHRILTVSCDRFLFFFHLWQKVPIWSRLICGCEQVVCSRVCFFSVCLDTSCSALVTGGCRWGLTGHQIDTQEVQRHRRFDEHLQYPLSILKVKGGNVWNQRNLCYMYITMVYTVCLEDFFKSVHLKKMLCCK